MGIFLLQNIFEIMSKSIKLEKMSLQNFYKKRTQMVRFLLFFAIILCVFVNYKTCQSHQLVCVVTPKLFPQSFLQHR